MRTCLLSNTFILICLVAVLSGSATEKSEIDMASTLVEGPLINDLNELTAFLDSESVLNVIPADVTGFIYAQNLLGLNREINTLLADLSSEEPPQQLLAKIPWIFGAGFESLEELEKLGLDLNRDFAIFFTDTMPFVPSAAVHVKDTKAIKQFIETESEVINTVDYNGITYNATADGGGFVILDDLLVYSGIAEMCKKAIDTYQKEIPSITINANYASLKLDTESGTNDLVAYFAVESIVQTVLPILIERVDAMATGMEEHAETNPQLSLRLEISKNVLDGGIWLLDQADALALTFQLDGSDLKILPFLRFKGESKVQEYISRMPMKLKHVEHLPQYAFLNCSTQINPEDTIQLITLVNKMFIPANADVDEQKPEHAWLELTKHTSDFFALFGSEVSVSMNFSKSLMPDVLFILDTIAADKLEGFMDKQYLAYLQANHGIYEAMGTPELSIFRGIKPGPEEAHNGVTIKSYLFPNFSVAFDDLPPQIEGLIPGKWLNYYAIKHDKLLLSFSANAQPIRNALDQIGTNSIGFDEGPGYDKVVNALTLENNMLLAISPITALKNIIRVLAQTDSSIGMLQMLLVNLPENYSIGIAAQNRRGGVEGKIFVSLGDFKELINMAAALQNMQQMD